MARIGAQGFFEQPGLPAAMDIPNTGAVLDDNGAPSWEPQVDSSVDRGFGNIPFVHNSGMGILERLKQVDETILELITERKELIDQITTALKNTKKMTETLSYVEAAKEVIDNG